MFWLGLFLLASVPLSVLLGMVGLHVYLRLYYLDRVPRIFVEKPIFILPHGEPRPDAEDVKLTTPDGLTLRGCYFRTTAVARKGVILFGLEFGANRWSCEPYCDPLREAGYDIFAFEPRNQGESDAEPGYEPLQWVTDREVTDCETALAYLKKRPDADPRGVGLFGISKGGGAGIVVAAGDPAIRCVLTDGAFAHYTVMVPYMRHWFSIYDPNYLFHGLLGGWYYGLIALVAIREVERERKVKFIDVEPAIRKISPRPLFMIHGELDSYIKPSMARALFDRAREPKEFWLVPDAKHNQALNLVPEEYGRRVRDFFDKHLGKDSP